MMKVQSFGCQPLKPSYQMNSKPAFGHWEHEDWEADDFETLKRNRLEMEAMAQNKDSKFLSAIGTMGVGLAAGALSFYTFKTMAPKGWNALKAMYNKVASWGFVQKSAKFIKEKSVALGAKIAKAYNDIKPESRTGKVKTFISNKLNWVKDKTSPVTNRIKSWYNSAKDYIVKHKSGLKECAKNTGATLAAIPASVTAVNAELVKEEGGED